MWGENEVFLMWRIGYAYYAKKCEAKSVAGFAYMYIISSYKYKCRKKKLKFPVLVGTTVKSTETSS